MTLIFSVHLMLSERSSQRPFCLSNCLSHFRSTATQFKVLKWTSHHTTERCF